jgi:hypothetical protein
MPMTLKFVCPLRTDMELRERARREGRSLSEVILRAVERGLGTSPAVEMPEAVVDRAERGSHGSTATALYLSQPLAGAIKRLASEQDRSASWICRDLLRSELRRRGVLATPPDQPSNSAA